MAITLDGTVGITTADIAATTLTVNAGFGSNATAYGVRAWVNWNGTGTVAIRASGNVSSITDRAVGQYTVNFARSRPGPQYTGNFIRGQFTGQYTRSTPGSQFASSYSNQFAGSRNKQYSGLTVSSNYTENTKTLWLRIA